MPDYVFSASLNKERTFVTAGEFCAYTGVRSV